MQKYFHCIFKLAIKKLLLKKQEVSKCYYIYKQKLSRAPKLYKKKNSFQIYLINLIFFYSSNELCTFLYVYEV